MADRRSHSSSAGFALIEIMIATMILATSLITLLSLQSSAVQRAVRDRNQQDAMLVARSIMSAIEVDPDQVEMQDTTMPAREMLNQLLPQDTAKQDEELLLFYERFQANLRVDEVPLPLPNQEPVMMKRVTLLIFWGSGAAEQMQTVFFVQSDTGGIL
jgi:type II secretory pathway pseudopilin PulG